MPRPHVQGYNLYHIHTDGDNCVSDNKGCFIGKDGLAKKEESVWVFTCFFTSRMRHENESFPRLFLPLSPTSLIHSMISTSWRTFNSSSPMKLQIMSKRKTHGQMERLQVISSSASPVYCQVVFLWIESNICLVLIPYDMPLNTHIYTEDFKYTINMVEPNWNF